MSDLNKIIDRYINEAVLDKEYSMIDTYFLNDVLYYGEFGQTLGAAGIKAHLQCWNEIFTTIEFKINHTDKTDLGQTLYFSEKLIHNGSFKSIPATKKELTSHGVLSFGAKDQKIITYVAQRNMDDITLQLVDSNEAEYNAVINMPVLSCPHEIHLKALLQYFKLDEIDISLKQLEFLCAWKVLGAGFILEKIMGLSSELIDEYQNTLQHVFSCSSEKQLFDKLNKPYINKLMDKSYYLLMSFKHRHNNNCGRFTYMTQPEFIV